MGDVDSGFGRESDRDWVDLRGRFSASGVDVDAVTGEVAESAGGHLGASGVVHAKEQHTSSASGSQAVDLGEGVERFACEPFGQQGGKLVILALGTRC